MAAFEAGLDGVSFSSHGSRLIGGFYKAAGETARPTAVLLHGLPGVEKHLDVAYRLRDLGWNCLYFHFRGSWGSEGAYSLARLVEDTEAAVDWVAKQSCVDAQRIVLIGGSTGSHPALVHGAADARIRGFVGVSPLIEPNAFQFTTELADAFAGMLSRVTGEQLIEQWKAQASLLASLEAFLPRPTLMVTAGRDDIFPRSHYDTAKARFPAVEWLEHADSDHGFSTARPWLVTTITEWLIATFGR